MNLFLDVFIIVGLFFLFALSHSVLAAFDLKKRLSEKIGNQIAFYRLFYNISSVLILIAIYFISPKPDVVIYDLQFPYDLLIFGIQFLGIVGIYWTSTFIDMKEFLGIGQIKRYLEGNYNVAEIDESQEFVIKGPFKYSRHPLYFFSIVILGFRPVMDLFYLVLFICMLLYFYIGSIYEERSLEKKYGKAYLDYKVKVPRIVPNPFVKI